MCVVCVLYCILYIMYVGTEVLHQEGHAAAVYSIGFQCDGALVATG